MDDVLDGLAHAAWEAYCQEFITRFRRRPLHVGKPPNGKPIYRAFDKIAALCVHNEFDVYDYIKTCFDTTGKNSTYMSPNEFIGEPFITNHKKYLKCNSDHSHLSFAFQLAKLQEIASNKSMDVLDLLSSVAYDFTSWFRIFALNEFQPDIWNRYGQSAWNELRLDTQMRRTLIDINKPLFERFEQQYGRFGD